MNLVNLSDFGIKSINYYWDRREKFNLTEDELRKNGVSGNFAQVDQRLIPKLKAANQTFKSSGYELIIKDGYRSPELYLLVQKKRYQIDGKENTDKTLNTDRMAHSTGLVVDVSLIDLKTGQEVELYCKKDWPRWSFHQLLQKQKRSKKPKNPATPGPANPNHA